MMKTTLAMIVVALVAAASASAATPRPMQCFRAHNWIVKGTNHHGTAWPRPKRLVREVGHSFYPHAQWVFVKSMSTGTWSPEMVYAIGLSRRQLRVARLCTGDHHL